MPDFEENNAPPTEEEYSQPGQIESSVARAEDASPLRDHVFPIVGIGGSAGGLDAFKRLLQALPDDTDMAFVIVQHLDPKHTSQLPDILAKDTAMPVRNVEDNMPVRPNEVYVIPPNTTMVLQDGVLRLEKREPGLHLPIDAFFRSLAQAQGSRAIGVILSGNASDGSLGVRAIKEECGLTFAQDEASAQHPGMPRNAITTGAIDYVLPPANIARELVRLSQHPLVRPPASGERRADSLPEGDGELSKLFQILYRQTKIDFSHYKINTIRRRIGRRMLVKHTETLKEYVQALDKDPGEARELYRDLLISVTNFFRDPPVFEALTELLRGMLKQRRSGEPFRVWVPGCATGEELYSLAICIKELLEELDLTHVVQMFGTDVSDVALDRARAGIYPEFIGQVVTAERLRRFFVRVERGYQVSKAIRELCVFARQDVTNDPPFAHMDLISCRNLLIYLDGVLQRKVLPIFHYSLNETGLLVLGTAETINSASDLFAVVDKQNRIYSRTAEPVRLTLNLTANRGGDQEPEIVKVRTTAAGLELQKKADLVLQSKYSPPAVVINTDMEILHFRGRTGFYLEPVPGQASLNLIRMAREGLAPHLRSLVEAATRQNVSVMESAIAVDFQGERREIAVEVTPIPGADPSEHYFVVAFLESRSQSPPALPAAPSAPADATDYTTSLDATNQDLERQILELREQLRNAHEDHEAHSEELWASNEEVQSANEELQSTNEELSTTKEELQSANEELTTLNEELQTRNTELNTSNSDFGNLLSAVDVPFLMVDNDLRLRRFSTASEAVLGVRALDVGHPVTHLDGRIDLQALQPLMRNVIERLRAEQLEIQDNSGHWYSVSIRPYRTVDNRIDGAVVIFFDVDILKKTLRATEEARDFAESLIETVREPLVVLDADLRVQRATSAFYETFQVSRTETEGRLLYDLGNGQWNTPRLRELIGDTLFRNDSFQDFEMEHIFPHIGRRRMRLNARRISAEGEQQRRVLLAIEDITERREEAEIRYQRLFETAKDGMVVCDVERERVTDVNPFALELTVYPREEWVGRSLSELEAFRNAPQAMKIVSEASSKEIVRHDGVVLLARDGRKIYADLVANRYVIGNRQVVQVNMRDVTARHIASEALRESEERFRLLVENVEDHALFQLNPEGRISNWNVGAQRIFGYTDSEVVGQPFRRIFTIEDVEAGAPEQELERARRTGNSEDERWHVRKDGSRFFASGVVTAIRDPQGTLRGFVNIMRDVTEHRLASEKLKQHAELLRISVSEKEALLKEVHHRVKNNLQVIVSLLNLQARQIEEKSVLALFEETRNRVLAISSIHEQLYQGTSFANIELTSCARRLVPSLVRFYSLEQRVRVEFDGEAGVTLELERAIPFAMLLNELVSNACKHAFPPPEAGTIRIGIHEEGRRIELIVADTGRGLPAGLDYKQTSSLGLMLVQGMVRQLRGTLELRSEAGTIARVLFPSAGSEFQE
ncbi:MAG TPA: chemotaxis protein CheB [Candidatus Limnocylindrales bacterium]|nr:chemotaxis protein CheB [Candidatus Limnocylindrales bacterium]